MRPFEKQFFLLLSDFWSSGAEKCALPEEEWQQWKRLVRDVDGPDHLLKHPDFFARESHGLAIGVVPFWTQGERSIGNYFYSANQYLFLVSKPADKQSNAETSVALSDLESGQGQRFANVNELLADLAEDE